MATKVHAEPKLTTHSDHYSPRSNFEADLALEFLRVVEEAAIASAKTMGQGERKLADQVATEAMRSVMDSVPMDGTIVIGEGERDEAPMLYIGEKVGKHDGGHYPEVDIAVDPLEGTNLCATGSPGAITVLAASEKNGLLHAPDCYMEKIVVGPSCKGVVDLEAPVGHNLKVIAKVLGRKVEDLVIIILERPRHEKLIAVPTSWSRRRRDHAAPGGSHEEGFARHDHCRGARRLGHGARVVQPGRLPRSGQRHLRDGHQGPERRSQAEAGVRPVPVLQEDGRDERRVAREDRGRAAAHQSEGVRHRCTRTEETFQRALHGLVTKLKTSSDQAKTYRAAQPKLAGLNAAANRAWNAAGLTTCG